MSRSDVTPKKSAPAIRPFRGVSADDRRERRRAALLEAAIAAFGTRGFYRTTVRDVCTEAQLTERYFYESFPNLSALFSAAYQHVIQQLREAIVRVVQSGPREPLAMAEVSLRVYLTFLAEDRPRARLILIEAIAIGEHMTENANAATRDFVRILRRSTESLYPSAKAQGLDLSMVASGLIGATNYIAYDWTQRDFAAPLDAVLRNVLALYQGMILQIRAGEAAPRAARARAPKARVRASANKSAAKRTGTKSAVREPRQR